MTRADQLGPLVRKLATRAEPARVPGWRAIVALRVEGSPWLSLRADQRGVAVTTWTGDQSGVTTEVEMSERGARLWLLEGVDYTHLLKSGDINLIRGSQFDLLLLSKSFGLRPERRQEIAP